jgi:hypothetical protein
VKLEDVIASLTAERDALKAERDTAHKWIADVHKMLGRGTHGSAKMDMDCAISGLADVLIASRENSAAEAAATERAEAAEEALRTLSERTGYLCDAIDRALVAARRPKTGMQVPFHGDFASASPSVLGRLEWWARDLRSVMPASAKAEGAGEGTQ